MKHLFTLFALVCLSAVLFAQRGTYENPVKVFKHLQSGHQTELFAKQNETGNGIKLLAPNRTRGTIWVNDSVLFYKADGTEWELTERYNVLLRDDYGNMTNARTRFNNPMTGVWENEDTITASSYVPTSPHTYMEKPWNSDAQQWADTSNYREFDENGQWTVSLFRVWHPVDNKFISGTKVYQTTDQNGNISSKTGYDWNTALQQWYPDEKWIYTYDDSGNKTQDLNQYWNIETEDWSDKLQNIFTYDADGNLKEWLTQVWNSSTGEWKNNSRSLYSHDGDGNVTERIIQHWSSETENWINDSRETSQYDDSGNQTVQLFQDWLSESETWGNVWQWLLNYDEQGTPTQSVYQTWNDETGKWENNLKFFTSYDDSGNLTQALQQNWNNETGEWENSAQWSYSYDEHENLTQDLFLLWNKQAGEWENGLKYVYYWSEFETSGIVGINETNISIYPNPVTDNMIIEGDAATNLISVKIMTVTGRLAKTAVLNGRKSRIDVSGFSKGTYILHVETDKGTYTKKIVKL